MFDSVPNSTASHTKSGAEPVECSVEMSHLIDENHHLRELVFLSEFTKKSHSKLRLPRLRRLNVELLSYRRIDRVDQPVTLTVDTDQFLLITI